MSLCAVRRYLRSSLVAVARPCPNGFLTYRYAPACAARESRKVGHVSHVWGTGRMGRHGSASTFPCCATAPWVGAYRLGCDKSQTTKGRTMFCQKCGQQVPDGSTFCTHCGASLAGGSAPTSAGAGPSSAPGLTQSVPPVAPAPQKSKSKAPIVIAVACAAVVLLGGWHGVCAHDA